MVLVRDVHVVTRPDVVTDLDRQVTDDPRAPTDETAIADAHHRSTETLLTGDHARRQRDVLTDHRVRADVDVVLVHDRRRRETDHASGTERPETPTGPGARTDRAVETDRFEQGFRHGGDQTTDDPADDATGSPQHGRHATVASMEAPEARTPNGWIGLDRDGVSVFKGIPFANAERFEASETLPGTPGRADTYRPRSLQVPGLMERFLGGSNQSMDEDCLTLNIFTPDATARLPVMVWIHGGAFVNGSGSVPWYDGSALARRYGVVVVTVNYRLGLLGFTGEDDLGLGDQISALAWVRDNIAEFGGDPESVTVFGESAGGASVIALLAAPSAAGLLHRGIAMSPSMPQLRSRRRAAEAVEEVLRAARVDHPDELRALPAERLLEVQDAVLSGGDDSLTAFSPTLGGALLPVDSIDRVAEDPRPMMIGTTRDEMHLFTAFDPAVNGLDDAGALARYRGWFDTGAEEALARYRSRRPDHTPGQLVSAAQTDQIFRHPARRLVERRTAPTHLWWFTFATPAFDGVLGACHALDIPFALDNLHRPGVEIFTGDGPDRQGLADRFSAAITSFARDDDPGWPSAESGTVILDGSDTRTVAHPEPELLEVWDQR